MTETVDPYLNICKWPHTKGYWLSQFNTSYHQSWIKDVLVSCLCMCTLCVLRLLLCASVTGVCLLLFQLCGGFSRTVLRCQQSTSFPGRMNNSNMCSLSLPHSQSIAPPNLSLTFLSDIGSSSQCIYSHYVTYSFHSKARKNNDWQWANASLSEAVLKAF